MSGTATLSDVSAEAMVGGLDHAQSLRWTGLLQDRPRFGDRCELGTPQEVPESTLARAEILHVHVRPQPGVVGEVPAVVVRILVDHDGIGFPQPVAAVGEIERRDAEEEPAKPETFRTPTAEMKDVAAPEPAGEPTMLKWMIEVVVAVVATRAMANPAAVGVHVRCIRMSITVTEIRMVSLRFRRPAKRTGTMVRDESPTTHVPATTSMNAAAAPLRQHRNRTYDKQHQETNVLFHDCLTGILATLNRS